MEQKRIAAIVGSMRENSYNRQLALAAKEIIGERAAFEIVEFSDVPYMNQDIEYPAPEPVRRVREQIKAVAPDFVCSECETCKWQIEMSTDYKVKNPILILAEALDLEATAKANSR